MQNIRDRGSDLCVGMGVVKMVMEKDIKTKVKVIKIESPDPPEYTSVF